MDTYLPWPTQASMSQPGHASSAINSAGFSFLKTYAPFVLLIECACWMTSEQEIPSVFNSDLINLLCAVCFYAALPHLGQTIQVEHGGLIATLLHRWPDLGKEYMAPDTNYLGAAVFVSYIVVALVATGKVVSVLYRETQKQRLHLRDLEPLPPGNNARRTLCVAALISFSILSLNMVWFLVKSYQTWLSVHRSYWTEPLTWRIWSWMTTSTLFRDFAQELSHNSTARAWSQWELNFTFYAFQLMRTYARTYAIEHLQWFLVLGQILPVSFSATLFALAIVLKQERKKIEEYRVASSGLAKSSVLPSEMILSNLSNASARKSYYLHIIPAVAFSQLSLLLPQLSSTRLFIPAVLLLRLLILQPWLPSSTLSSKSRVPIKRLEDSITPATSTRTRSIEPHQMFSLSAALYNCYNLLICLAAVPCRRRLVDALTMLLEHHAVGALGMDSIILVSGAIVWILWSAPSTNELFRLQFAGVLCALWVYFRLQQVVE